MRVMISLRTTGLNGLSVWRRVESGTTWSGTRVACAIRSSVRVHTAASHQNAAGTPSTCTITPGRVTDADPTAVVTPTNAITDADRCVGNALRAVAVAAAPAPGPPLAAPGQPAARQMRTEAWTARTLSTATIEPRILRRRRRTPFPEPPHHRCEHRANKQRDRQHSCSQRHGVLTGDRRQHRSAQAGHRSRHHTEQDRHRHQQRTRTSAAVTASAVVAGFTTPDRRDGRPRPMHSPRRGLKPVSPP
jgi:hypothetical protein